MSAKRQLQLDRALQDILRTLASRYQPEKVILFGSMARAEVGEWSDLDLVIIKDTPQPFLQRLKEVALLCRAPVGVDFLVYTPVEFNSMITDNNQFVIEEIVKKGRVLYERDPAETVA